jgi:hypothetical protein
MTAIEIRDKILSMGDIVMAIQKHVKLKKIGTNWNGLCPFHNERTPSFMVDPKKKIFKCFGCGQGGDIIEWTMKMEKLTFVEAIDMISKEQNIKIEYDAYKKGIDGERKILAVSKEVFLDTLRGYEKNVLLQYLSSVMGVSETLSCSMKYFVGTAQKGGTIFWQVDALGRVRTGQRIFYNTNGHRKKEIKPLRLYTQSNGYFPCLFGEHLLKEWTRQHLVAIVESEKTAIVCSHYFPKLFGRPCIWLACSGAQGMTTEKAAALKGMEVVLVPDFSYAARATWGCAEMRRKEQDGKKVISEDGELDKEYVPLKIKIGLVAKTVSFLDAWKEIKDGSDLADLLLARQDYTLPFH